MKEPTPSTKCAACKLLPKVEPLKAKELPPLLVPGLPMNLANAERRYENVNNSSVLNAVTSAPESIDERRLGSTPNVPLGEGEKNGKG